METNIYSKVLAVTKAGIIPFIIITLVLGWNLVPAQGNPLNRKVTFQVKEGPLEEVLVVMSEKGKFYFAYNSEVTPVDSIVTFLAQNEKVKKLLDELFEGEMSYSAVGNHIVLRPAEKPEKKNVPDWIEISGFLIDGKTGEKIQYGTVYDPEKHNSSLTKADGSYSLRVPGYLKSLPISFHRIGYRDTVVIVRPQTDRNLTVGLMPLPLDRLERREVSLVGDSYQEELPLTRIFVPEVQQRRAFNLNRALANFPVQFSLVPSIGTNGLMSGGMTNVVSINLLAGYAAGVKGVEIGGLVNMDRENVLGVQVGGLANIVGGDVLGTQVAGINNHVRGSFTGFQAGGIYNMVDDTMTGVQVGGIFNIIHHDIHGVQVGGIFNIAEEDMDGVQVAGLFNRAGGEVKWVQAAGLFNTAESNVGGGQAAGLYNESGDSVGGFQAAGLINTARGSVGGFQAAGLVNRAKGDVGGFQAAGLANKAKGTVGGLQVAGIFNRAEKVKGMQIGLINISDTLEGYALGLINWSKNGYKAIGFGSNDVDHVRLELRSGRPKLYNFLSLGLRLTEGQRAWSYGGGVGSTVSFTPSLGTNLELSIQQVNEEGLGAGRLNLVHSFRPSLVFSPTPWFELAAGPGISLGVANAFGNNGEFLSNVPLNPFWSYDSRRARVSSWVGYQGSIRISF